MNILNVGDEFMNTWLYQAEDGWVMVDTGYAENWEPVCQRLSEGGIGLDQVKYVFLTHAHDDHAGFLRFLLDQWPQMKCVVNEASLPALKQGRNACEGGGCAGEEAVAACLAMANAGKAKHVFPALGDSYRDRFILVSPGHTAEAEALLGGKILFTPGHTCDSMSLALGQLLFCGDAAMEGGPSHDHITMWVSDPEEFARSWETLLASGAEIVVPAHGRPFLLEELQDCLEKAREMVLLDMKGRPMARN